ncbi:hypothetical protein [Catellatospora chokoriensis]|uniref:hypothetical protein n=1 Tax=Catellatospora chokoriensis TaxID=310353 RepID=UPI001785A252|nr:hypothetical protein [Catellatospora chokoriensis]
MRKAVVASVVGVAILIAAAYFTYASLTRTGEIRVGVGVNGCIDTNCVTLPLPEADVTVTFADGHKLSGKTDATGVTNFRTDRSGEVTITATSPLLSEPITTTADISDGGYLSVDMADPAPFKLVRAS